MERVCVKYGTAARALSGFLPIGTLHPSEPCWSVSSRQTVVAVPLFLRKARVGRTLLQGGRAWRTGGCKGSLMKPGGFA